MGKISAVVALAGIMSFGVSAFAQGQKPAEFSGTTNLKLGQDEYWKHIQNLKIAPPARYTKIEERKCSSKEPLRTRQQALEACIEYSGEMADCGLADLEDTDAAAMACYHLSVVYQSTNKKKAQQYRKKALAYLLQESEMTETVIKLTSPRNWSKLRDLYFMRGDSLNAGKLEWLLGERQRAMQSITASLIFQHKLEESKEDIAQGRYDVAIERLWSLKIPFYRQVITGLCDNNQRCLEKLHYYNSSKDVSK